MNQKEALRLLAGDVLAKLNELKTYDEKYGHDLAPLNTKDHGRWMRAHEELEYRLLRIENPSLRRAPQVAPVDPNQVALFG